MGSKSSKVQENVKVLMPIYLYPDEVNMKIYRRVVKSSESVPMTLIVNPNNGPYRSSEFRLGKSSKGDRECKQYRLRSLELHEA